MIKLKLVIVDDEPIILEGLKTTYDWNDMGFEVVGTAGDAKTALEIIKVERPHVVLTDIRMKQMTGLDLMLTAKELGLSCIFIVLSAYQEFSYAQKACELGAFAYLLKPLMQDELRDKMWKVYTKCFENMKNEVKTEAWEEFLLNDGMDFQQVVIQKYLDGKISEEKIRGFFESIFDTDYLNGQFVTIDVELDLELRITDGDAFSQKKADYYSELEMRLKNCYRYWNIALSDDIVFVVKVKDNQDVVLINRYAKEVAEYMQVQCRSFVSKAYKGIPGIKQSYREVMEKFERNIKETDIALFNEAIMKRNETLENQLISAVRRNDKKMMHMALLTFIEEITEEEIQQARLFHKLMLKIEVLLEESYGMTPEIKRQFRNFYDNGNLMPATKLVDICSKILGASIDQRIQVYDKQKSEKDYMSEAITFIEDNLKEPELSIVDVADYVYLNPVYFGRVFKETQNMTFKQYLLQKRMEKAKTLLKDEAVSIGTIGEEVGILNPSYFSQLFKQYTGKLPSEYKRDLKG